MGLGKQRINTVGNSVVTNFKKVFDSVLKITNINPAKATALTPKIVKISRGVLFKLFNTVSIANRIPLILSLLLYLRKEVPNVFKKIPLTPKDFGFKNTEEFVNFLVKNIHSIETSAKTLKEFSSQSYLKGLKWNIVGGVLFERLVKYNQHMNKFFLEWAEGFRKNINDNIKNIGHHWMLDLKGNRVKVTEKFGAPRKVLEFILEGDEDVRPNFTDFGTISVNSKGQVVITPVEIKLPAAMEGAKKQQADFKQRLLKAKSLTAVIEEGKPPITIDPKNLVFDTESSHHIAITLYTKRRWQKEGLIPVLKNGKRLFDVEPIKELRPTINPQTGSSFYKMRITVMRDWLTEFVELIVNPKP